MSSFCNKNARQKFCSWCELPLLQTLPDSLKSLFLPKNVCLQTEKINLNGRNAESPCGFLCPGCCVGSGCGPCELKKSRERRLGPFRGVFLGSVASAVPPAGAWHSPISLHLGNSS